jgi:hypothetical protein
MIRRGLVSLAAVVLLATSISGRQASQGAGTATTLQAMLAVLPNAKPPALDRSQALWLATMPLSCVDHAQGAPQTRGYVWEANYRPPDDYQKTLAFYGCYDWHSSVNSIWTLVRLLKGFPDLPVAGLVRQKLDKHLGKSNMEGELTYLKGAGQFERPYGYAWILKLAAEVSEWDDADGRKWAANMAPLADWAAKEMVQFFTDLPQPSRVGVHANSAFAMYLMLDYVDLTKDESLRASIVQNAKRFFENDKNCSTKLEPAGSDFLSPCLTEAALMGRIVERPAFQTWIDTFLPQLQSADFKPLTEPVETAGVSRPEQLAGKSHLIGLAFQRGIMMNRIADLLPAGDLRADVLHRLAAIHGVKGMQGMHDAGYLGSHWLGTYAVYYMLPPERRAD